MKNVVRVYRDRIAFCVNNECALYCRFCLRKRMVGRRRVDHEEARARGRARLDPRGRPRSATCCSRAATRWFSPTRSSSGCSPSCARSRHVEIVRLGTRLPVTLPFRVTDALCAHARAPPPDLGEHALQSPERAHRPRRRRRAIGCCARASRSATRACFSRGINDDVATMKALCEGLVRMRVRPYYCYQAQLLEGTAHFRVPIERGIEIFRALRGRTSGFAIPHVRARHAVRQGPARLPVPARPRRRRRRRRGLDGRIWRELNPA